MRKRRETQPSPLDQNSAQHSEQTTHPKHLYQKNSCEKTHGALAALSALVYQGFRKHNGQLKEKRLFNHSTSFIYVDLMKKDFNFKEFSRDHSRLQP